MWLAEHHFVPYGVCPSAVTLAGLMLGRTRRIRVGTAVSVLPSAHPVSLGEQTALLHVTSGGRFTLGVGRGGPWVDLEVFGAGSMPSRRTFPSRWTCCCDGCASPGRRPAARATPSARWRWCHGRTSWTGAARGPPVVVACTSPRPYRAARRRRGLPMLLGMHSPDDDKAAMVALAPHGTRRRTHAADAVATTGHVSAGVVQVADSVRTPSETLAKAMPGWLRQGRPRPAPYDAGPRSMRDPAAYTALLCALHPVGPPGLCADRLAATARRTGVSRFALLVEGSGDLAATDWRTSPAWAATYSRLS